MANLVQLKMLENTHGFLLVDKPVGIAFSTVVKAVKRKFNLTKVGHGGSLDAAASGLMVLLINDANKFVADVMGADRAYEGEMLLGVKTNTHDTHGETIGTSPVPQGSELEAKLAEVLPEFKGDIFQTESRYCSVRREGSAAYEIADTGEHKQFLSHVYRLDVEKVEEEVEGVRSKVEQRNDNLCSAKGPKNENHHCSTSNLQPSTCIGRLRFSVLGEKSLLVKTLVNDLGERIGCGATLDRLRRTKVGKFKVEDAVPFDRLLDTEMKDFAALCVPLSVALR